MVEAAYAGKIGIKIEALRNTKIRFTELSIMYSSRLGEIKLNPWRDGFYNLGFLVKKRFGRRTASPIALAEERLARGTSE